MSANRFHQCATAIEARTNCNMPFMLLLLTCLTLSVHAEVLTKPPCPTGKDTTLVICPFKGYAPDLLLLNNLPLNGVWEPALQQPAGQGYYNSCVDSSSVYIYTTSVPECPEVQDTVNFNLRWSPPCNWEYEACITADQYEVTIPPYPEFVGNSYHIDFYAAASQGSNFEWESCGSWTLNPGLTNTISWAPGWDNNEFTNHCVDVRLSEPVSGCEWYFPPFDYGYEYWDCEVPSCETIAVEPISTFKSIKVYPVPTEDVLFIDIENPITEILISGADGRLYKRITRLASKSIEVADLVPGWYFLKIFDGHRWYVARMIK
ncbi:MAG TPA: T9SS type A sorting domain-containing protein [Saprospiraceae bacterium]